MDKQDAANILNTAIATRDATEARAAQARLHLYDTIRQVTPTLRQVDIAKATGWSREHIRNIVNGTQ